MVCLVILHEKLVVRKVIAFGVQGDDLVFSLYRWEKAESMDILAEKTVDARKDCKAAYLVCFKIQPESRKTITSVMTSSGSI